MRLIAEALGENNFAEFKAKLDEYDQVKDRDQRRNLFLELENTFTKNYTDFSESTKKVIVLFFDTYEVIQDSEISRWLEITLFPSLKGDIRIIVAGRLPLELISAEETELGHFELKYTIQFLKACFEIEDDKESESRIGSREIIEKLMD